MLSKSIRLKPLNGRNVRRLRQHLRITQEGFWGKVTGIGLTQSVGSRYENGRPIPTPTQQVIRLVHIGQVNPNSITKHSGEDIQVGAMIRKESPEMYRYYVERLHRHNGNKKKYKSK